MGFFSKQCSKCGKETKDSLELFNKTEEGYDKNSLYLCREHLVEELEKRFEEYQSKILLLEPTNDISILAFYPVQSFKEYEEDQKVLQNIFSKPLNICEECKNKPGKVIYCSKESYSEKDIPKGRIENIAKNSKVVCDRCAINLFRPYLVNSKSKKIWIDEPYGGDGTYAIL